MYVCIPTIIPDPSTASFSWPDTIPRRTPNTRTPEHKTGFLTALHCSGHPCASRAHRRELFTQSYRIARPQAAFRGDTLGHPTAPQDARRCSQRQSRPSNNSGRKARKLPKRPKEPFQRLLEAKSGPLISTSELSAKSKLEALDAFIRIARLYAVSPT